MSYVKSAVSSAYIHIQPKVGFDGQVVLEVFDANKETVVVIDLDRADLLSALGAVDAPVKVPTGTGAVIVTENSVTWVLSAPDDEQLPWWSVEGSAWKSNEDAARALQNGGSVLSEGVEQ